MAMVICHRLPQRRQLAPVGYSKAIIEIGRDCTEETAAAAADWKQWHYTFTFTFTLSASITLTIGLLSSSPPHSADDSGLKCTSVNGAAEANIMWQLQEFWWRWVIRAALAVLARKRPVANAKDGLPVCLFVSVCVRVFVEKSSSLLTQTTTATHTHTDTHTNRLPLPGQRVQEREEERKKEKKPKKRREKECQWEPVQECKKKHWATSWNK